MSTNKENITASEPYLCFCMLHNRIMAYKNAETCSTVNTTKTVLCLMQKLKHSLKKNLQKLSATEGRRLALLFSLKSRRSKTAVEVSDNFIRFMMIL